MKKYYILAAVALVASAACTKVEVDNTPNKKIAFEVASYVPQTKATEGGSMLSEGLYSFVTNAWFTPAATSGSTVQHFMDDVSIFPYNGTTKITSGAIQPTKWAPEYDYFWPKTGSINFFSYASKNSITPSSVGDDVYGAKIVFGTADGTAYTVVSDDNILVADAVYRATANTNDITVTGETGTPSGVPTLFRHVLAKLQMTFSLETNTATVNTDYVVSITSASLASVANKGVLTLTTSAPDGTAMATNTWSNNNTSKPKVGWVNKNSSNEMYGTENLTLLTPSLTLTHATTSTAGTVGNLLALRTVMPQSLSDDLVLSITYRVQAKHGDSAYSDENITVTKKLNTIAALQDWEMNKIITYNVKINPVTTEVYFDPAVLAWTSEEKDTQNIEF